MNVQTAGPHTPPHVARHRHAAYYDARRSFPDSRWPLHDGYSAVAPVGFLIGIFLTLSGCYHAESEYFGTTLPRHSAEVLWVNNGAEPQWIDPGKCSDSNGGEIIFNTFAGLVQAHPVTLEPLPDIAHNWVVSDDGRTYTFHLRSTQWSDGQPLTAHDFEWSLRRLLDPKTASKYANIAYDLKHAMAFHQRALLVRGLSDPSSAEEIKRLLSSSSIEITAVEACPDVGGFFIYLGGDENKRANLRQRALDIINDLSINDSQLSAKVTDSSVVGVRAIDNLTLRLELNNPVPYFLNLLTFYSFMPIPRHVLEQLESAGQNTDLWTRPEHFVSNGAYVLKRWQFRQSMDFEKNPYYWDAAHVRTPSVHASMVESYNTALNLYFTGELDFPGGNTALPNEFMDELRQYKDFRSDPYLGAYFYWFNTKQAPMDDVNVRQAFSLAIDRNAIVQHVTRGGQIPSANLVPDGLAGYQGLKGVQFDPHQARQLLAKAGYPDGQGLPQVTLIYNTSEGHKQIAVAVQQMWKENLNVDVQIQNQEWQVYLSKLGQMDFQIARMGWIGDYPDPYTFLDLLTSYSGNNHSGWVDEHYDTLLQQSKTENDHQQRLEILQRAERHMIQQQPILPIYIYTRSQLVKPYVRGFWSNYMDRHPWKYLWIETNWHAGMEHSDDDPAPPLRTHH